MPTTACLWALGFDVTVRTDDAALARFLDATLGALAVPGPASHQYSLATEGPADNPSYVIALDGAVLRRVDDRATALGHLLWDLNRRAIETAGGRHLLIHAAAAESAGRVVLLPGPSGSGKTTLVAGLVRAGLRYVTDEAVALGLEDGLVHPYAKPLDVEAGSWPVLADLAPPDDPALAPYPSDQWHVAPGIFGAGRVAPGAAAPVLVVAPTYQTGVGAELVPLARSHTLVSLAEQSFNFADHGVHALDLLAATLRRCECYRLHYDDLAAAAELVVGLLNQPPAQP